MRSLTPKATAIFVNFFVRRVHATSVSIVEEADTTILFFSFCWDVNFSDR